MTLPSRAYPALLLLACIGAMATALTTQYGFGLQPCILCFYQRIPYVVAGLLMLVAVLPRLSPRLRLLLVGLAALAFAIDCGIAIFHVGVEHHWWESACVGGANPEAASVEDLQALLAGPPPVPCDRIPWAIFGISMAGWNAVFAACLAIFSLWSVTKLKEQR